MQVFFERMDDGSPNLKVCHPVCFLIIINLKRRSNTTLSTNEELHNPIPPGHARDRA
jgi:hypothetical protein